MEKGLTIEISGTALLGKNAEIFERRVHSRVLSIADKVEIKSYNFARLEWRFEWTAKIFDINRVDSLHVSILRLIGEFLDKWTYDIKINRVESGGVR